MKRTLLVCAVLLAYALPVLATGHQHPLPRGYTTWKKSIRKVVSDKSSLFYGVHYLYADKKALQGYRAGNRFPEGSRIVVEHFAIRPGNTAVDGPKNMVVLMVKDKRQKATGGWLYAGYTAQGKPSGLDTVANCFTCHQKEAGRDYVFSGSADFR